MKTLIIIGNVNVNNDTQIKPITGDYGWHGADKVRAGSMGTERVINLGEVPLPKWNVQSLEEVKAMIGEFVLAGFTVRVEEVE